MIEGRRRERERRRLGSGPGANCGTGGVVRLRSSGIGAQSGYGRPRRQAIRDEKEQIMIALAQLADRGVGHQWR